MCLNEQVSKTCIGQLPLDIVQIPGTPYALPCLGIPIQHKVCIMNWAQTPAGWCKNLYLFIYVYIYGGIDARIYPDVL